jgi:ribonuclease BN (tRNA processing enzyme)/HSP20 family molecular chaperone IbpA
MRLTVLGKSPSWQDADGACSGYLVEEGDTCLLVDCGNGVFSKLRRYRDYAAVDAVVISHLHADHFLDLVPFSYALTYAPKRQPVPIQRWPGDPDPRKPRLICPPGSRETFRTIVGSWGNDDLIENAFDLEEYGVADKPQVGSLTIEFTNVPHFTETFALKIHSSANGGGWLAYGADSSPNDDVVEFARGADLLMIEATLPRPERTGMRHARPASTRAPPASSPSFSPTSRTRWTSSGPVGRRRPDSAARFRSQARAPSSRSRRRNLLPVPSEKDLFANFERMRREIDELFGDVFGRSALVRQSGFVPHVDVAYMGDPPVSVVIQAELAGVDPSRVALEIRGRRLIIAGERHGTDATGCFYQQVEIEHGPFRREIELGTDVDADRARATYDNGILRVEVPVVLPEERVRSIPVRKAIGPRTGDQT